MTRIPSFHAVPTRGGVTTGIPGGAWTNPGSPWAKGYVYGGHREFVDRSRNFTIGGEQIPGTVLYPYPAPLASIMAALWRASSWTVTASCSLAVSEAWASASGSLSVGVGGFAGSLDAELEIDLSRPVAVTISDTTTDSTSGTFDHGEAVYVFSEAGGSVATLTQPDIDQRLFGQWISSAGGTGSEWFSGPRLNVGTSFRATASNPPVDGSADIGFSFGVGFSAPGNIPTPLAHVSGGEWYLPLNFTGAISIGAGDLYPLGRGVSAYSEISAWPPTVTGWSEVESPTDNLVVTIDGVTIMDTPLYVWGLADYTWDLSIRLDGTV